MLAARAIKLANERQHKHDILREGRSQIDRQLDSRPWEEVGAFAAYSCQMKSLRLKSWELPPCEVRVDNTDPECAYAAKLLRRLLAAGLSRYEPDPVSALQAVEARARGHLPAA